MFSSHASSLARSLLYIHILTSAFIISQPGYGQVNPKVAIVGRACVRIVGCLLVRVCSSVCVVPPLEAWYSRESSHACLCMRAHAWFVCVVVCALSWLRVPVCRVVVYCGWNKYRACASNSQSFRVGEPRAECRKVGAPFSPPISMLQAADLARACRQTPPPHGIKVAPKHIHTRQSGSARRQH